MLNRMGAQLFQMKLEIESRVNLIWVYRAWVQKPTAVPEFVGLIEE